MNSENINERKKGLWDRIHARREKGLPPKKPHEKGYPKTLDIEEGLKQARKNVGASKCWAGKKIGIPPTKMKNRKEVPNCVPEQVEAQRYCPKCQKNESRSECKYGPKYWDLYSIPMSLSSDAYDPNDPHPTNEENEIFYVEATKLAKGEGGSPYEPYNKPKSPLKPTQPPEGFDKFREKYGIPKKPSLQVAHYIPQEYSDWRADFELLEDWQKINRQDNTDGLSAKAVKAYRRENPGSKLKTAVTTDPSKLKVGSKDWKRRKNFCSRSRSWKDEDGKAARRRWNCN